MYKTYFNQQKLIKTLLLRRSEAMNIKKHIMEAQAQPRAEAEEAARHSAEKAAHWQAAATEALERCSVLEQQAKQLAEEDAKRRRRCSVLEQQAKQSAE